LLVLVTNRADLTTDLVVLELERRQAEFVRLNTDNDWAQFAWIPGARHAIIAGTPVDIADIEGVWWRRPVYPQMTRDRSQAEANWAGREALAALDGFLRTAEARWINKPEATIAADSKPEQLVRALRRGFDVPTTLVTNDTRSARDFARNVGAVVCKALYEGIVPTESGEELFFTTPLDADALAALDELGPEPYLFQARVQKLYDVRVTVVGGNAWACRIDASSDPTAEGDWRRADPALLDHHVEPLPERLAELCVELVRSYGLRFAAIDLARRVDGGYSFFEVNPNGEWGWIEQLTELPICSALVDELLSPCS
jgi:glutathione synthase/RimK-type ligase-like ATP-grasp enzyme